MGTPRVWQGPGVGGCPGPAPGARTARTLAPDARLTVGGVAGVSSDHGPSKYRVARDVLSDADGPDLDAEEIEAILDERDVDGVLREYGTSLPAITTDGLRPLSSLFAEAN